MQQEELRGILQDFSNWATIDKSGRMVTLPEYCCRKRCFNFVSNRDGTRLPSGCLGNGWFHWKGI